MRSGVTGSRLNACCRLSPGVCITGGPGRSRELKDRRLSAALARPLSKQPLFPSMVVQMLEVGEQTGQTSQMLEKVADFYDSEVEAAVKALTSIMEPVMIIFVGGIVGVIVVSMYLPLFNVYNSIK